MKDKKLVGVGIVGAVMVIGGIAYANRKNGGEGKAILQIEVYDSQGNLVPKNSPISLNEGGSYTAKLTVKNTSTKGGLPVAAILTVGISAGTEWVTLIQSQESHQSFDSGATRTFSYPFTVPVGQGGTRGSITAWVSDPAGVTLASDDEIVDIIALPIVYGATIVIS